MNSATAAWVSPPTRPEHIENLVSGVDRYNPANVAILEDYLYHQIRSQEYDCLANLAILKLYQFNSELYNADVVINILIKALTSVPFPDFNLCISLLDERVNALHADRDEPDPLPTFLPTLTSMYTLLRQCRFVDFWELYRSEPLDDLRDNYTIECVGLEDAVRDVVIRSVKMTFTRISLDRLGSYLDLSGEELEAYIQKIGWFLEGPTVRIPKSPDNQLEATIVEESIQFPQLTKIISHAIQ